MKKTELQVLSTPINEILVNNLGYTTEQVKEMRRDLIRREYGFTTFTDEQLDGFTSEEFEKYLNYDKRTIRQCLVEYSQNDHNLNLLMIDGIADVFIGLPASVRLALAKYFIDNCPKIAEKWINAYVGGVIHAIRSASDMENDSQEYRPNYGCLFKDFNEHLTLRALGSTEFFKQEFESR